MIKSFTLIVCTYMRPKALINLLDSVNKQILYPNEILIIDGSTNSKTEDVLKTNHYNNLKYFKVSKEERGLTKQRNFGINLIDESSEVVCFLDDDIVLTPNYFEELLNTYNIHEEALGVGGYIMNEVKWKKEQQLKNKSSFYFDGWQRIEPSRFKIRRLFGLIPDVAPGFMPISSHGRSISFLPPSGNIYEVELLMGGVSSYKKEVFKKISFSNYFEGYGLYEDADFSLRLSKLGALYVNTKAQLSHHHEPNGRPNQYNYGKMVIRNGWYVWRVKYPSPSLKVKLKWHLTAYLLICIRFANVINTSKRREAFIECLGRVIGWFSLLFNKPKIKL